MQERNLNQLELIYGLVERLMLTSDFNKEELEDVIGSVRDELDGIRLHYEAPAPTGAEAVQDLMLESLTLFDESFEEITLFLQDEDEDRLGRAVSQAEEANDILVAIEDVIQNNKHVLSEMVEA